jgi:hypothetical protein
MSANPGAREISNYSTLEYLYRDASNYKAWGCVLLTGMATPSEIQCVTSCLVDSCFFVAELVGVPVLYEALYQFSGGETEDDHAFHEFFALRAATQKEAATLPVWGSVEDLLRAFCEARGACLS